YLGKRPDPGELDTIRRPGSNRPQSESKPVLTRTDHVRPRTNAADRRRLFPGRGADRPDLHEPSSPTNDPAAGAEEADVSARHESRGAQVGRGSLQRAHYADRRRGLPRREQWESDLHQRNRLDRRRRAAPAAEVSRKWGLELVRPPARRERAACAGRLKP